MHVNHLRTIYDSKAVSIEPYVYGFSTTWIIHYNDGRKERANWMDKKTEREIKLNLHHDKTGNSLKIKVGQNE